MGGLGGGGSSRGGGNVGGNGDGCGVWWGGRLNPLLGGVGYPGRSGGRSGIGSCGRLGDWIGSGCGSGWIGGKGIGLGWGGCCGSLLGGWGVAGGIGVVMGGL